LIATVGAIALSSQTANQASIVFSFPLGSYAALPTALAVDAAGNSYVVTEGAARGFEDLERYGMHFAREQDGRNLTAVVRGAHFPPHGVRR
jgi:hypothetical protein